VYLPLSLDGLILCPVGSALREKRERVRSCCQVGSDSILDILGEREESLLCLSRFFFSWVWEDSGGQADLGGHLGKSGHSQK